MKTPTALKNLKILYFGNPFGIITTSYLAICLITFSICKISKVWSIDIKCTSANLVSDIFTSNWRSAAFKLIFFPFDTTTKDYFEYFFNIFTALPALSLFERIHGSFFAIVIGQAIMISYVIQFAFLSFMSGSFIKLQGVEIFNMVIWSYIVINESKLGSHIRIWKTEKKLSLTSCLLISIFVIKQFVADFESIPKLLAISAALLAPLLRKIITFFFLPTSAIEKVEERFLGDEEEINFSKIKYFRQPEEELFGKYISILAEDPVLPIVTDSKVTKSIASNITLVEVKA